jgi:hypothetical protein
MNLYFLIISYLLLVLSYLAYKMEYITFAYILLIIGGLNLIALTISLYDGSDYNF